MPHKTSHPLHARIKSFLQREKSPAPLSMVVPHSRTRPCRQAQRLPARRRDHQNAALFICRATRQLNAGNRSRWRGRACRLSASLIKWFDNRPVYLWQHAEDFNVMPNDREILLGVDQTVSRARGRASVSPDAKEFELRACGDAGASMSCAPIHFPGSLAR